MPEARVKALDVCARRLVNQGLVRPATGKASEVVASLGAVQAQDYFGGKWGLAQRARGVAEADVEAELSAGAILRTHVLRPTWHFVAPEDIRWMLALTAPRIRMVLAHYDRTLGIDAKVLRRSRVVLTRALRNGQHLTRAELAAELVKAGVRVDGTQRLARIVMHAELDALICSGARRGKQFTYALLDERARPSRPMERDAAMHELARRYFTTRGPATEADFAWWSGLTKGDAVRAARSAESSLDTAVVGKTRYWFPQARAPRLKSPLVRLLPTYDEYFIGLRDRSAMHGRLSAARDLERVGFPSMNLVTIDGQAVGEWTRTVKPKSGTITVELYIALGAKERDGIAREVERLAAFSDCPYDIVLKRA
ncbi:MAG TPA: winged helix DNA-binding domain-containing protein [Gemmatimonadaceae bacterium]|nr:winged helix DNA-binding domain-containing protein [Gemmatimonadaceae bacterium]